MLAGRIGHTPSGLEPRAAVCARAGRTRGFTSRPPSALLARKGVPLGTHRTSSGTFEELEVIRTSVGCLDREDATRDHSLRPRRLRPFTDPAPPHRRGGPQHRLARQLRLPSDDTSATGSCAPATNGCGRMPRKPILPRRARWWTGRTRRRSGSEPPCWVERSLVDVPGWSGGEGAQRLGLGIVSILRPGHCDDHRLLALRQSLSLPSAKIREIVVRATPVIR
jgi:hypothetical protein